MKNLEKKTIALIQKGNILDDEFNAHAMLLFQAQYEGIPEYKRFCETRQKTPDNVELYTEIPALPTDVFKHISLFWGEEKKRTFQTSGTTQGLRGQHYFDTLDIYNASMEKPFLDYVLKKEVDAFLILAPPSDLLEDSSLSYMLTRMANRYAPHHVYFVGIDEDKALQMEYEKLKSRLDGTTKKVAILTTAFALIGFLDAYPGQKWTLPAGSLVMETGGLKGRGRELSRKEFYQMIVGRLGISERSIVSEYSMTELSSQSYTNTIADEISWEDAAYFTPPWARVDLVDPRTMLVDNSLERGLIRWFDLANVYSISAILTSDMGTLKGERSGRRGFELLGRAVGAQIRGCSLTIEEILTP